MLDQTFSALSDPTRRAIIARLGDEGELAVGVLARPIRMSLPAVLKHLDVLANAGLITRTRHGRTVTCRLTPAPMDEAMLWMETHARFWNERLDALQKLVEAGNAPKR